MASGGKRPGAGRRRGSRGRKTLEKAAVQEAFNQRVMQKADALFHAQFSLAVGSAKVFRIDEEGTGKNKKRVHTLVTDEDEIKALLDEHGGGSGEVDGSFYYITTSQPDNRALDSLLNRALGKPKDTVEHSGDVSLTHKVVRVPPKMNKDEWPQPSKQSMRPSRAPRRS